MLPSDIDGQGTLELSDQLTAIAPDRPAGSDADLQAAQWVKGQLAQVPGGAGRVQTQDLVANADGDRVSLRNVYLVVPGSGGLRPLPGIVVLAPRDTPAGVSGGASATAVMLRLARASATTRHERPHLFVSVDGNTVGNAGTRWFLRRFSSFPLEAAIVLDGPGDAQGDRVHVWIRGRTDRQSAGLAPFAERAIGRAGGRADASPSLVDQLLGLAVPQTFGDQGAAIALGLSAVTLSGRPDSPLSPAPAPTAERMELVANAANDLLGALDSTARVPSADGGLELAGKRLRPTATRLALLLLALPVLALAVDAAAGLRRARVPLVPGIRAVALRALPLLGALAVAYLLALGGLLPRPAAGVPPLPAEARFGAAAALGLVVAVAAGVLASVWTGRRARRLDVTRAAEGTAALVALGVVLVRAVDREPLRPGPGPPRGARGGGGPRRAAALAPARPGRRGRPADPRPDPEHVGPPRLQPDLRGVVPGGDHHRRRARGGGADRGDAGHRLRVDHDPARPAARPQGPRHRAAPPPGRLRPPAIVGTGGRTPRLRLGGHPGLQRARVGATPGGGAAGGAPDPRPPDRGPVRGRRVDRRHVRGPRRPGRRRARDRRRSPAAQLRQGRGPHGGLPRGAGDAIVTIDGDLQDDPAEIPRLLAELEAGADLVSGWKRERQDSWSKRAASRVFNGVTVAHVRRPACTT